MFADRRVVARRKAHDEIMGVSGLGGRDDLGIGRAELAQRNVLANGATEQMDNLADISDRPAQRAARNRSNILTVDEHTAAAGVVETQQQVQHGRLAAARRSDQRRDLARLCDKAHAAQNRGVIAISEMHVGEFDARLCQLQRRQFSSFGSPAGLSITS